MADERNVFYIFHVVQKAILYNGGSGWEGREWGSLLLCRKEGV
jgi:hypothetical protein